MRRRVAGLLRRMANGLDSHSIPPLGVSIGGAKETQVTVTFNGRPIDMEKAVVTALTNHRRRNGLGGLA